MAKVRPVEHAISREQLDAIRAQINAALAAIVTVSNGEHRETLPKLRSLQLGKCKYDVDGSFTFQLDGTVGGGKTVEEQLYDSLCRSPWISYRSPASAQLEGGKSHMEGKQLPPLGASFVHRGETYRIEGANRGGRVIAARVTAGRTLGETERAQRFLFWPEQIVHRSRVVSEVA